MFGISIQKLLVLIVIIAGVIAAFRVISSLKRQQELARRNREAQDARRPRRREEPAPGDQAQIQDMAACGRCGAYIAAEAGGCGRRDCPFKGA